MNPIIVIIVFVVILAGLLYYLQGRQGEPEILPVTSKEEKDRKIVKVNDYQAQYEKEQKSPEAEEEKTETQEKPEPIQEESEEEDISLLDGVGPKYQELLRAAGYNTIKSIAETAPEALHAKLIEVNNETEITKRPPTMSNVEEWVTSSKARQA